MYIAETENLRGVATEVNVFFEVENEIGFIIKPIEFYKYCWAYIKVQDLQAILKRNGWDAYKIVRKDNLTRICGETPSIQLAEIESLVKKMQPYLNIL